MTTSAQLDQEVAEKCEAYKAIHAAWNELTKAWSLPVIHSLGIREPARFNELKRRIDGISSTSLADRLTELERLGIIQRKVYPASPPRVEYSLTDKGKDLLNVLHQFADWAKRWERNPPAPAP
ncbi:MAG TPA: helix-turn-helix domain-containing protein [Conexivisphaerales archaeon]|nr:helix-turn-helix domain-containing protein [Conexivisphaerales archaeon]